MTHPARLVEVVRSGVTESVHRGSVAVADPGGRLTAWAGDPGVVAFARSSMKPLQAAMVLSLVGDGLTDAEIAVMCGSHNGEPVHVQQVASILRRAGVGFDTLRCPPARPLDPEAAAAVAAPEPRYMNCSGKHAGMVLACVRRGWDTATYPDPGHPLQVRILEAVREATGEDPAIGVDGCGIPVHALSLRALATLFARLAEPDRLGELAPFASRAVAAMRAEPYQVAGRDRVCTGLMSAVPGLAVKVGAEGLICAAIVRDAGSLGVAVKIDDGSARAAGPALVASLDALGVGLGGVSADLREPPVKGGGETVGSLRARVELARS